MSSANSSKTPVTISVRKNGRVVVKKYAELWDARHGVRWIEPSAIVCVVGATVEELYDRRQPKTKTALATERCESATARFYAMAAELRRIRSSKQLKATFLAETLRAAFAAEDEMNAAADALRALNRRTGKKKAA